MRSFFAGPGLQALLKALIQVKAHTRKDGTQVRAHTRNVQTKGERRELVTALSQKMAAGGHVRHATLASALGGARHASKVNGKAAHVYEHPEGGWVATHDESHTAGHKERIVAVKGKARLHQAKGPSRSLAHIQGPIAEHVEKPFTPKVKPVRPKAPKKPARQAPGTEAAALVDRAKALGMRLPPKVLEDLANGNQREIESVRKTLDTLERLRAGTPEPAPKPKPVRTPEQEELLKQRDRILPETRKMKWPDAPQTSRYTWSNNGKWDIDKRPAVGAYLRHQDNRILLNFYNPPPAEVVEAMEKRGFVHTPGVAMYGLHAGQTQHAWVAPFSQKTHRFANYTVRRIRSYRSFDEERDRKDENWLKLTPDQRMGYALAPLEPWSQSAPRQYGLTQPNDTGRLLLQRMQKVGLEAPPDVAERLLKNRNENKREVTYWQRKTAAAEAAARPDLQPRDTTPRGLLLRAKEAHLVMTPEFAQAVLDHDHKSIVALGRAVTRREHALGAPFRGREESQLMANGLSNEHDPLWFKTGNNMRWHRQPMEVLERAHRAGLTLSPADVEDVIHGHPQVLERVKQAVTSAETRKPASIVKLPQLKPDIPMVKALAGVPPVPRSGLLFARWR